MHDLKATKTRIVRTMCKLAPAWEESENSTKNASSQSKHHICDQNKRPRVFFLRDVVVSDSCCLLYSDFSLLLFLLMSRDSYGLTVNLERRDLHHIHIKVKAHVSWQVGINFWERIFRDVVMDDRPNIPCLESTNNIINFTNINNISVWFLLQQLQRPCRLWQ